jgi:uncharacterized membrane protein (DUF106 family)
MSWWLSIPASTLLIMTLALLVDAATLSLSRKFVGVERMRLLQKQSKEYMRYLKQVSAGKAGLKSKLKKKKAQVDRLQRAVMKQYLKLYVIIGPIFFSFFAFLAGIPMLGISGLYPLGHAVAYLPFKFSLVGEVCAEGTKVSFYIWFIVCAFGFSPILSRVFGFGK